MHLITLPGFGLTPPQELPIPNVSYGDQIWTNGCIKGIVNYIKNEELRKPSVVAYFNIATQIAIRLTIEYTDLIDKAIIIGGSMALIDPSSTKYPTLPERINANDNYFAPKWFKTISKEQWKEGNFTAEFFSLNPAKTIELVNEMNSISMPIMIQYLCEFNSQDVSLDVNKIQNPLLSIVPNFSKEFFETENLINSYIKENYINPWKNISNSQVTFQLIENSGNCVLLDQPEVVSKIIKEFLFD